MPTPVNDSYPAVASGLRFYAGKARPGTPVFDQVTHVDKAGATPIAESAFLGKPLVVKLHGSGGGDTIKSNATRLYTADVSGLMAYDIQNKFQWATSTANAASQMTTLGYYPYFVEPVDAYINASRVVKESMWMGFKHLGSEDIKLITKRRLDTLMNWIASTLKPDQTRVYLTGGSMGGWGTLLYGLRRPDVFAALYPSRPRWRYGYNAGEVGVPDYTYGGNGWDKATVAQSPIVAADDGGGLWANRIDHIAYVAETANEIPWIGWCCGTADGYMPWEDQCAAVDALRAAGRGFAFYWNGGGHSDTTIVGMTPILKSYRYGRFEKGKGYPRFFDHSEDKDPRLDPIGGVNIGLDFKDVVEDAHGWSCYVTSVDGPCTVKVTPISKVFTASVAPVTVNITAANTWVPVSFSA